MVTAGILTGLDTAWLISIHQARCLLVCSCGVVSAPWASSAPVLQAPAESIPQLLGVAPALTPRTWPHSPCASQY